MISEEYQPADPVVARLNAALKVGPKGYEHGWRFVGAPGSSDHLNTLRQFSNRVDEVNQEAGHAADRAITRMSGGETHLAAGHMENVAFLLRASGHEDLAREADRHARIMHGMHDVGLNPTSRRTEPRMGQFEALGETPAQPHAFTPPHTRAPEIPARRESSAQEFIEQASAPDLSGPSRYDYWGLPKS